MGAGRQAGWLAGWQAGRQAYLPGEHQAAGCCLQHAPVLTETTPWAPMRAAMRSCLFLPSCPDTRLAYTAHACPCQTCAHASSTASGYTGHPLKHAWHWHAQQQTASVAGLGHGKPSPTFWVCLADSQSLNLWKCERLADSIGARDVLARQ